MTPKTKLEAAKAYLGNRWVLHPNYVFDPRHSNDPHRYVQARQPYLTLVIDAAAADRTANPSFTNHH